MMQLSLWCRTNASVTRERQDMDSDRFDALSRALTSASSRRALIGPALAAALAGAFRADPVVAKKGKKNKKGVCRRVRLRECTVCGRGGIGSQPDGTPCSYGGTCQNGACTSQICTPTGPCPTGCLCLRPPSVAAPVCVVPPPPMAPIAGTCPESCPVGTICGTTGIGFVFCHSPCSVP